MKIKKMKIIIISISYVIFSIGAFVVVTVTTPPASEVRAYSTEETEGTNENVPSVAADKDEAKKLIGKTLTREEVKEQLGNWNKFVMSNNGCERGVYAGRFYYEDYIIFSTTYDKGQTFNIISINEQ